MSENFLRTCGIWCLSIIIILCLRTTTTATPVSIQQDSKNSYLTTKTPGGSKDFSAKYYTLRQQFSLRFVNNSGVYRNVLTSKSESEYGSMEGMDNRSFFPRYSVLIQVLIFICCAAGVAAVIILCCLICLHGLQLFSRSSTMILGNDGRVHMVPVPSRTSNDRFNLNSIQIQRNANNETVLTFVPVHRHPWSPGVLNTDNEQFTFHPEEINDLPPSYEDLTSKEEEASSPLPPPYTPSFQCVKTGES